jgi:hypothetical protein
MRLSLRWGKGRRRQRVSLAVAALPAKQTEFVCVECRRKPRIEENPADEWRAYSDGTELHLFCPDCAEREFADS